MRRSITDVSDDALVAEQFLAMTRGIPNAFVNILIMSAIFCGFTFKETPSDTIIWAVAPLVAICGSRALYWRSLGRRAHEIPIEKKRGLLQTVTRLCMALCVCFASIVVFNLPAPEIFVQSSIAMLVIVSAITIALHLFTLPLAALSVLWSASASMIYVFIRSQNLILVSSAFAILAIAVALTRLLQQHFGNFRQLVISRAEVELMREDALNLAMTDALTGLPNRRMFDERMKACARSNRRFAVAVIDLDGFKPINDLYGHAVGDLFLAEAARRMTAAGTSILIARMGGDEFAMLIENVDRIEDAAAVAQRAIDLISAPYAFANVSAVLGASCGVAMWRQPGDENRLIERADIALYAAKAKDRGAVAMFADALERDMHERALIESGLREAVVGDEFEVRFQPIIRLATGELTGFEALARWRHGALGDVSPNVFIPIAEQVGLIEVVTDRLLRKAARAAVAWPEGVSLSFNLSATQLVRPSAALTILATLAECGLSPHRFEGEVTESVIMADVAAAGATIAALKLAGARVSLDDFGTGYSSFSELCELPLDQVKIDKSLIDKISDDARAASVVVAIVKMCDGLDLKCVAEGVERADQLALLKDVGCEKAQGFLIARPLTEAAAYELAAEKFADIRLSA